MRKFLSFICSVLLAFSFCLPVSAADGEKSNEIVILYTNDAHAQWPDITQRDGNGMWFGGPTGGTASMTLRFTTRRRIAGKRWIERQAIVLRDIVTFYRIQAMDLICFLPL